MQPESEWICRYSGYVYLMIFVRRILKEIKTCECTAIYSAKIIYRNSIGSCYYFPIFVFHLITPKGCLQSTVTVYVHTKQYYVYRVLSETSTASQKTRQPVFVQ